MNSDTNNRNPNQKQDNQNQDKGNVFNHGFIPVGPFKQEFFDQFNNHYQKSVRKTKNEVITSDDIMKVVLFMMESCKNFNPSCKVSYDRTKYTLDSALLLMLTVGIPF